MDIKLKKSYSTKKEIIFVVILCMIAALFYIVKTPAFRTMARQEYQNPAESEETAKNLYKSAYILYQDLYEKVNNTKASFEELYLDLEVLEENITFSGEEYYDYIPEEYIYMKNDDGSFILKKGEIEKIMKNIMEEIESDFKKVFSSCSRIFDYRIVDNETGISISNTGNNYEDINQYNYCVRISYDKNGQIEKISVRTENSEKFLKIISELGRDNGVLGEYELDVLEENLGSSIRTLSPKNCTLWISISEENMNLVSEYSGNYYGNHNINYSYSYTGANTWRTTLLYVIMLILLILPIKNNIWEKKIFRLPFEGVMIFFLFLMRMENPYSMISVSVVNYCEGIMAESVRWLAPNSTGLVSFLWIFGLITAYLLSGAYVALCFKEIRVIGVRKYFVQRCYIYRFFPFIKRKIKQCYQYFTRFDISTDTNKVIIKLLIFNGILVSFFTFFWFAGVFAVLLYSVVLYYIFRRYFGEIKNKYQILLKATNEIAEGNLNVTIEEDLGLFEPFKAQIKKIQEGFKNAVEEEVKSQRMKTELVTNVSHDLKTPLTAIITYINLLKEEDVTREQQLEYLKTLEKKSLRLKILIEDLFEVSKANSKNISLNIVDVDIVGLMKQVQFEMEDKLQAAKLDVRFQSNQDRLILKLDSQKAYRIYENLLNNVAKYALEGTRVYINIGIENQEAVVKIKNISAQEINTASEELAERFVRGDASRNTEGSGLGLAIAKSFVEIQGGSMEIAIDGDLFKVTTRWKLEE